MLSRSKKKYSSKTQAREKAASILLVRMEYRAAFFFLNKVKGVMFLINQYIGYVKVSLILLLALGASYCDIKYRKIPNKLTFPMMLAGMIAGASGGGFAGFMDSLKGLLIGFAFLLVFYLTIGGIGEGDIKLLAAFGAVGGAMYVVRTAVYGVILGGIYAFLYLLSKKRLAPTLKWIILLLPGLLCKDIRENIPYADETMPYGPFLAVGAVLALFLV